jgi:hypothetical protein
MNAAAEKLATASHKLVEAIYSKTRAAGTGAADAGADSGAGAGNGAGQDSGAPGGGAKDDVVDADYKEVK